MISPPSSVPLTYTVAQSTPHSGKYGPEHILADKPSDQASRWSGAYQGNNAKQWILLKLDQMSILSAWALLALGELLNVSQLLETIVFGKVSIYSVVSSDILNSLSSSPSVRLYQA